MDVGLVRMPERSSALAPLLSLGLGLVVVLVARWGPDWPAQEFRAWVAAHDGLTAWTSRWYGGEALPGYSVLYPVLGGVLGAGAVGLVASVVAAWASAAMAPADPVRARWFAVTVAVCLAQNLLIGQVPFLLGVAFGMLAIRSLVRGQSIGWVAMFAAGCSLSSPLAGTCLLIAAPALSRVTGWSRAAALAPSMVGMAVAVVVGGAGGPFPFPVLSFAGVVAFCVVVLAVAKADNAALRCFALCYLCAAVVVFLLPNGVGGNIARVGKLIAVPLAIRYLVVPRGLVRRMVSAVAVVLAAAWPSAAFASSIAHGANDPSQYAAYYTGLTSFLRTQDLGTGRVEIPFTREHWESMWVAQAFPIARGWERQTDLLYNRVLYRSLSATSYRSWLDDNAVSLVALPDAPIDYGGRAEADLLKNPPSYLQPVWHDQHWQVWRVLHARPFVSGAAQLTGSAASSLTLTFLRPGSAVVRIHASPLWRIADGTGCVDATARGWLRVSANQTGPVIVDAEINPRLVTGVASCAP